MGFSPQLPAYFSLQHPTYHVGSCAAITGKIMHVHVFFVPFAGQRWKKKGDQLPKDGHLGQKRRKGITWGWPFGARKRRFLPYPF